MTGKCGNEREGEEKESITAIYSAAFYPAIDAGAQFDISTKAT